MSGPPYKRLRGFACLPTSCFSGSSPRWLDTCAWVSAQERRPCAARDKVRFRLLKIRRIGRRCERLSRSMDMSGRCSNRRAFAASDSHHPTLGIRRRQQQLQIPPVEARGACGLACADSLAVVAERQMRPASTPATLSASPRRTVRASGALEQSQRILRPSVCGQHRRPSCSVAQR